MDLACEQREYENSESEEEEEEEENSDEWESDTDTDSESEEEIEVNMDSNDTASCFHFNSGKVVLSDPLYCNKSNFQEEKRVVNVEPGKWKAEVEICEFEGRHWVKALTAFHINYNVKKKLKRRPRYIDNLGNESWIFGFFDKDCFGNDAAVEDLPKAYEDTLERKEGDEFIAAIKQAIKQNETPDSDESANWGVVPFGVASVAGFGNQMNTVQGVRINGKYVALQAEFIPWHNLCRFID